MEPDPSAEAPDEVLVARFLASDRAAIDQLVRRHQPEVTRLLWRFVRQRSDLEDLVQEVFLRVVRSLPGWREEQPFLHWLRRVTVNVGRDFCRRETVRRRWTEAEPGNVAAPAPEAIDPAPNPAARAAAGEVKDLLAHLPPDDRLLLTLHHLEGWDMARIGASMGWSVTATKLRAFRARRRLRAILTGAGKGALEDSEAPPET